MKTVSVVAVLALALASGAVRAAEPLTVNLALGTDGKYVADRWNPLQVTIHNPGSPFQAVLQVEIRTRSVEQEAPEPSTTCSRAIDVPAGKSTWDLGAPLPWLFSSATVRLVEGAPLLEKKFTSDSLGTQAGALTLVITNQADRLTALRESTSTSAFLTPRAASSLAWTYAAADCVVLDAFALDELPPHAWARLLEWTSSGGALLFTAPFLQANEQSQEVRDVIGCAVGSPAPLSTLGDLAGIFSAAPGLMPKSAPVLVSQPHWAEVLAAAGGKPVGLDRALGRGRVRAALVDPRGMTFATPDAQFAFSRRFWSKMLYGMRSNSLVEDLPGSMVPQEGRVQTLAIPLLIFLLAFVLVMGPINFLVLSRFRRRELMALTAPVVAVLFLIAAAFLAAVLHQPRSLVVSQTINYCSAGSPLWGELQMAGVLSAPTAPHDLVFPRPDTLVTELGNWGYFRPKPPLSLALDGQLTVQHFPVKRWSLRAFLAPGLIRCGTVEGRLKVGPDALTGYVENHLPIPLEDCYVIHKWNHMAVGTLAPGERKAVTLKLGAPSLSDYDWLHVEEGLTTQAFALAPQLWNTKLEGRRWELARAAEKQVETSFSEPVLIGWGGAPQAPPLADGLQNRAEEENLYLVRLPLDPAENTVVPLGASEAGVPYGVLDAGTWLLADPLDRARPSSSDTGPFMAVFALPLGPARGGKPQLKVQGRLTWAPGNTYMPKAHLDAFNWETRDWVQIGPNLTQNFSYTVSAPGRFLLGPRNLVRLRISALNDAEDKGSYYLRHSVKWLDVAYDGEGARS
jgi:hypothetical protein